MVKQVKAGKISVPAQLIFLGESGLAELAGYARKKFRK
jgi:hypothetical protein